MKGASSSQISSGNEYMSSGWVVPWKLNAGFKCRFPKIDNLAVDDMLNCLFLEYHEIIKLIKRSWSLVVW